MSKPNLQTFDEDTELNDAELEQEPEMKFYATGDDGAVIKLHDRMASVPIGFSGKEFQKQLEDEIKDYTDEEVMALAPFALVGRGIAGIDEMANAMDDTRVLFGLLQIQIGDGTFARYKNIFVHFQGEKMKILKRARANKQLAVAKELIGHTHAPLVVSNRASFTVEYIFNEFKRIFVSDSISGYQTSGTSKQQDINTLRINYQKRMESAKQEAEEERKRLEQERLKMEQEAKERALEEERIQLEELKREAERKKMEMQMEKKRKAEAERKLRHEKEDKERAERKRIKQEKEKKELEEEIKQNPNVSVEELKRVKKKKKRRKKRKKKDDWSDDKPWTPQRVLAAIHAQLSPINWGLFKPSQKDVIALKWGHGSLNELREELKPDEVLYGMIRLSFGSGRFRRSHWVYFLWTPDTMSSVHKKTNKRMKHVSYNGKMQELLAPWTLSLSVMGLDEVTISDWILRVKKTVVVDGSDDLFTEEAFRKALEEENKWIRQLKEKEKEIIEKQKEEEEHKKIEEIQAAARRRQAMAEKKHSNIYTRVQLRETNSNKNVTETPFTPTMGKDGNYYVDHEVDYDAINAQKAVEEKESETAKADEMVRFRQQSMIREEDEYESSSDDEPREPSPEPVIKLTEEELAVLEEERKKREAEELAKRTEKEMKYRTVLQSKMVLESVELVKRTAEKLCWILFAERD